MHLIASDFDGTLLIDKQINPLDIEKIKEFRSKGNKFVICTGRSIDSIYDALKEFEVPFDYIIGVNGAIAIDKNYHIVYSNEFDLKTVHNINTILDTYEILGYRLSNGLSHEYIEPNNLDQEKKEINEIRGYYINAGTEENALKLAEELNKKFEGKNAQAYKNMHYVALGIKGIHKGYGVQQLADLIGFKGNIHVIGDDYNDIPMLKRFNSYGIKSGYEEAISFAKHRVNSVLEAINHIEE
ncbi:HAD-superfamily hydrolase, subfamily IIB [Alteracholeplasma palmae J233]|uniref:HAD-superfamily hydrolase, subfamily IIB n=1 Tax=Alteracholeplasma palmae (strain ATCC 49389 / J233) TaxID=1318466 RepID=U4KL54_ALTPJ|nr:HAD-IIB family hydrolase [Alteracholeplasma palmae]CCV64614.1 HAD-superfamily hydrolase, subfamily IIB [Alteracholeplasma palmae J233]